MSKTLRTSLKIVIVAVVAIAAGFGWWDGSGIRFALNAVPGTATVESTPDLVTRTNDQDYFRAWVTHRDQDGIVHRQYIRIPTGAVVGSVFDVIYDPDAPTVVDRRSRADRLGGALIWPGVAILIGVGGAVQYWRAGRPSSWT